MKTLHACALVLAAYSSGCSTARHATPTEAATTNERTTLVSHGVVDDTKQDALALGTARALQEEFRELARRVGPSIVTVRAFVKSGTLANPAAKAPEFGWSGEDANATYFGHELMNSSSGFVIDETGEVLTCAHVLQKPDGTPADLIDIETADGSHILADFIGGEPTVNLAIVRCTVFPVEHAGRLPALKFGDSDAMESGDWAFAFGDPAGPGRFFSAGTFVSNPVRECYQDSMSSFFALAALVVPPLAYGGPLVNLNGEVVGILAPRDFGAGTFANTPKSGLELALPSKIVRGLHQSIRTVKSFQSPWLGFSVMSRDEIALVRGIDAFNALVKPKSGILIESVFTPSPAQAAGVLPGDFLVGFDAYKVFSPVDFQRYLYLAGVGKRVSLELFRDGRVVKVELTIERRPPEAMPR